MKYVTTWRRNQVPEHLRGQGYFDDIYEGRNVTAYVNDEGDYDVYEADAISPIDSWPGTCICDEPEPESPDHGHRNEAGGFCCPHKGNTCGHCHQYG